MTIDTSPPPDSDDWLTYRHDGQLTGYCRLKGNITHPQIRWKYFLGGLPGEISTLPTLRSETDLIVPSGGCLLRIRWTGELIWKSPALGIEGMCTLADVDGDGTTEVVASSGKELLILSSEDGRLLWRYYFGPPRSSGAYPPMILTHQFDKTRKGLQIIVGLLSSKEVLVFDFSDGVANARLQHTLWMNDAFNPTVVVADIDGDGQEEIIVTKLGAVYIFNPITGELKRRCDWISGGERRRNYGLFQIADVNNDGILECVSLSSAVTRHLSVVDNDGKGNLALLWDRFIEHIYPTDTTEVRHTINSVHDVDGDGLPEIVVSLYNTRQDQRWWLEVIDARNGNVKAEIPDHYLWGIQDVDGDGTFELLTSIEPMRIPKQHSQLQVLDWNGNVFAPIWEASEARFAGRSFGAQPDRSHFRGGYIESDEVWFKRLNGEDGFFVITENQNESKVHCVTAAGKTTREHFLALHGLRSLRIAAICDVNGDGENELVLVSEGGNIHVVDVHGEVLSQFSSGAKPSSSSIVFHSKMYSGSLLAIPDATEDIHLLRFDKATQQPRLVWKRAGKGRRGWNYSYHSPHAADIDGDGEYELLAGMDRDNASALQALSLSGEVKKEWVFGGFPSPKHGTRIGIYEWLQVASRESLGHLLVSFYASASMNSEETLCIDLATGKGKWRRKEVGEGEYGRGFGPWGLTTAVHDLSHATEALFLAKDTLCHFDSSSGEWKHSPWVLREATMEVMKKAGTLDISPESLASNTDPFTAYGSLIVCDVNGDGIEEFIVAGCFGALGVMDREHRILWWKSVPLADLSMRYPGVADVDNDGIIELGVGYSQGDFVCYSAVSGDAKWRINLGSITSDIVSCDIDGDGHPEFIAGTADGRLLVIGNGGVIKWSHDFGYSVGFPVIADFDEDGLPEILVAVGDGWLYSVGQA